MAQVKTFTLPNGEKRYQVRWSWYDAHGKRHSKRKRFKRLEDAKAKRRQEEQNIADSNLPDYAGGRKSVNHWAERWLETKSRRVKAKTAHGYRSILDSSVLPAFGHVQIRSITTADIQEWVDSMTQAPPTIKHHHAVLRAVLAHAVKGRAIRDNPARDVELPTDRSIGRVKVEPVFLTPEQIGRLAHALRNLWPYDLMVTFTAYTGLRAAEVSGLNVEDMDPLHNEVMVRRTRARINGEHVTKSGHGRRVPMPAWLAEDMAAYLARHPNRRTGAPLFPGRKFDPQPGGQRGAMDWSKPYNHELFYRRMWKPAVAEAGLSSVRFHDLRHTFASLMAREGVPPYRVAKYMGHKDATVTLMIYTHLWDDDASQDANRLARPTTPQGVPSLDARRRPHA